MPDFGSIHFLAPGVGLAAASIGTPILLIFYFLKLRRRPVRVSSAMLWRDAARDLQVNVPLRMIRPSWLLLLQLLILALLAGALGRPVLDVRSAPPARIVLVIDNSASMAAADSPGAPSRLEQARTRAKELIRRLRSGTSEVAVVAFASRSSVRFPFASDLGAAAAAVDAIEQTDEPGDLSGVMRLIAPMAASGSAEAESRSPEAGDHAVGSIRVVMFSDGGDAERSLSGAIALPPGLGGTDFEFVRTGPPAERRTANDGIVSCAARRDYDDPAVVRVFCAIEHFGDVDRSTFLRATLAGVEVGSWPIQLKAASEEGPGRATKTFELVAPGGGLLKLEIGSGDGLGSDDAAWVLLEAPAQPSIWLVRAADASDTAASISLLEAIESVGEVDLRVMNATVYESEIGKATPGLVVFDGVRPARVPEAPSISFGEGLPIPGLIVRRASDGSGNPRATQVAFWVRSDPLMRGVTFPGTTIFSPRSITPPDTSAADTAVRAARVLARGSDGPLIVEIDDTARRVLVGFTLDETNWWKDPSFPVFIANAVEALTGGGAEAAGRIAHTGESVSLPWRGDGGEVAVSGPDGLVRRVTPGADGTLTLGVLPNAGVYSAGGGVVAAASVLDETESSLATSDALTVGGRAVAGSTVERLAPREVWHWFVIAAVALLAVEWWAYAMRMRT